MLDCANWWAGARLQLPARVDGPTRYVGIWLSRAEPWPALKNLDGRESVGKEKKEGEAGKRSRQQRGRRNGKRADLGYLLWVQMTVRGLGIAPRAESTPMCENELGFVTFFPFFLLVFTCDFIDHRLPT